MNIFFKQHAEYVLFTSYNFSLIHFLYDKVVSLTDQFLFVLAINSQYLLKGYWYFF